MKYVTDFFALYKRQILNMVWVVLGCMGFGVLLVAIIGLAAGDTAFPVGAIMVCFGGCGMLILYGAMMLQTKFDLQISMGATRKRIIAEYTAFMVLSVIIFWVGGLLSIRFEEFFYSRILRLPPDGENLYSILYYICRGMGRIYLIEAGLAVFVASASLRWGKGIWWGFYFLFLLGCQVPNFINIKLQKSARSAFYGNVLEMLTGTDLAGWVLSVVVAGVLFVLAWAIIRKQRCTL